MKCPAELKGLKTSSDTPLLYFVEACYWDQKAVIDPCV